MKKNDFKKIEKKIINKKFNYDKIGKLETLRGTNNIYWFTYSKKLNITIKSIKKTDIIIEIWNGKKTITKKMQGISEKIKIKNCLKWYQIIRIQIVLSLKTIIYIILNFKNLIKLIGKMKKLKV